jgi:hypothetical protein
MKPTSDSTPLFSGVHPPPKGNKFWVWLRVMFTRPKFNKENLEIYNRGNSTNHPVW